MPSVKDRQRLTIYIPKTTHRELRVIAAQLGESMNQLLLEALTKNLPELRDRATQAPV